MKSAERAREYIITLTGVRRIEPEYPTEFAVPSPSRRLGYLDRELRRNDTVKSGERANNINGRVTDATGIVDGCYFILPCPHATICCPHRELKQILPARRAIGYSSRPPAEGVLLWSIRLVFRAAAG